MQSLNKRRENHCVDLISNLSEPDHRLHNLLPDRIADTVEPPLSGPPLSGHTLLNGQMSKSQEYLLYIIKDTTSVKRPPLLSGRGHLRAAPNSAFF